MGARNGSRAGSPGPDAGSSTPVFASEKATTLEIDAFSAFFLDGPSSRVKTVSLNVN